MTITAPGLLSATEPPEIRGSSRSDVRLLVADGNGIVHSRFEELPRHLHEGDLLVVNDSPTMPAAIDAKRSAAGPVTVHVSGPTQDGAGWIVELRRPDRSGPILDALPGETLLLPATTSLQLADRVDLRGRLHRATLAGGSSMTRLLASHGRPIRYDYVGHEWGIDRYQTVFARPRRGFGSAEMPSAGRPFTPAVLADLARAGIEVAAITLHTGVSSLEAHEPPRPERFEVSDAAASAIAETRRRNRRVIAVGTTVVRTLETVAIAYRTVRPGRGWTDLVLDPDTPVSVVDGILTGWHPPEASHLDLIAAVAGNDRVADAYRAADSNGRYLMHEFGDAALLLR